MQKFKVINVNDKQYVIDADPIDESGCVYRVRLERPTAVKWEGHPEYFAWTPLDKQITLSKERIESGNNWDDVTLEELFQNSSVDTSSNVWALLDGSETRRFTEPSPLVLFFSHKTSVLRVMDGTAERYHLEHGGIIIPASWWGRVIERLSTEEAETLRSDGVVCFGAMDSLKITEGMSSVKSPSFDSLHQPEQLTMWKTVGLLRTLTSSNYQCCVSITPIFNLMELMGAYADEHQIDLEKNKSLILMALIYNTTPKSNVRLVSVDQYKEELFHKLTYTTNTPVGSNLCDK